MARKTKHELNKEKAAKQKKIAIAGGVLLVLLLAIQVPRTMKMMNPKPKLPVVSATTPNGTTTTAAPADPNSLAAPTLAGAPAAATTTTADTNDLVASVPLKADQGQLENFQRFASKDPFAAQVTNGGQPAASGGSSSSGSSKSGGGSSAGGRVTTVPITTTTPSAPSSPSMPATPSAPAPTTAVISLNGVAMTVTVNSDFPTTTPVFHLVSLTAKTARIGIAGGSYADGSQTITLKLKTPVTLQNTADGSKYTLILEPANTPVTGAATTTATPTTTTPASVPAVPSGSGG
jgi:hypothetical protein